MNEKDDDFLNDHPEIKEELEKTQKELKEIDGQIDRLREDAGPEPHFRLKGAPAISPEGTKAHNFAIWNKRRDEFLSSKQVGFNRGISHKSTGDQEKLRGIFKDRTSRQNVQGQLAEKAARSAIDQLTSSRIRKQLDEDKDVDRLVHKSSPATPRGIASLSSSKLTPMNRWAQNKDDITRDDR